LDSKILGTVIIYRSYGFKYERDLSGSGTFCMLKKSACKSWWRYQKWECWHE